MYLVMLGFVLTSLGILLREGLYKTREIPMTRKYGGLLGLCIGGSVAALLGFFQLASTSANSNTDYSQMLTILSILAAGITTGYFTFSYGDVGEDEHILATAIALVFVALFYLTFAAISFYMGKSEIIHSTEGANLIGPLIMWLILMGNVLYDFWDYREVDEEDTEY